MTTKEKEETTLKISQHHQFQFGFSVLSQLKKNGRNKTQAGKPKDPDPGQVWPKLWSSLYMPGSVLTVCPLSEAVRLGPLRLVGLVVQSVMQKAALKITPLLQTLAAVPLQDVHPGLGGPGSPLPTPSGAHRTGLECRAQPGEPLTICSHVTLPLLLGRRPSGPHSTLLVRWQCPCGCQAGCLCLLSWAP